MKKLLRALPLLLLVALLLASCGAPADDGTTTAAQDTTTSEVPALPAIWNGATYTEDTTVGDGAVTVTVKVTADEKTISITLKTDEETLADALLAEELCEGDLDTSGLYIKYVNGIRADYVLDGGYWWNLIVDGEMSMVGASYTTVTEGAVYELVRTK